MKLDANDPDSPLYRVWLDGVEQHWVTRLDTEEGWVERLVVNERNTPVFRSGPMEEAGFVTERVTGVVRVEKLPEWGAVEL